MNPRRASSVPRLLAIAASLLSAVTELPAQEPTREENPVALAAALRQAIQNRQWDAAEATATKLVGLDDTNATAWFHLGYARHAQKKYASALEAHVKAASFDDAGTKSAATYNAACVYALQNKADEAFVWLDKAVEAGFSDARLLESDTDLANLHADARFAALVERVSKLDAPDQLVAFSYTTPRKSARLVYFPSGMPGAQVVIEYAAVPWAKKYEGALDDPRFVGVRWRFGADAWTNLDTSAPLSIGGQRIEPGYYYLTLTHEGDKECVINVLDAARIRKARIDPAFASTTTGGQAITLDYAAIEGASGALSIDLVMDPRDKTKGKLEVKFGTHELSAPIEVDLDD